MNVRSLSRAIARDAAGCVLGATMLLAGCKATDTSATPWEIVHGTSAVSVSKAVDTASYAEIVTLSGRSGSITVADDSTVAGWFKDSASDSLHHFTGTLSFGGGGVTMSLSGYTPWKYRVITSSSFPNTYGLVSDTVLTANLVGDAGLEHYRLYWELQR